MTTPVYLEPISAEVVAAKLEAIANFQQPELLEELKEQPRLAEVLWFLQFVSQPANYAGGLGRFAAEFISDCRQELGTTQMMLWRDHKRLTFNQIREIYCEMDADAHYAVANAGDAGERLHRLFRHRIDQLSMGDFILDDDNQLTGRTAVEQKPCSVSEKAAIVALFTRERLIDICKEAAERGLANYFKNLCERPNVTFRRRGSRDWNDTAPRAPWYFVNVADALLAFIDRRKETLAARIAETEITKQVFEWMRIAQQTGRGVLIEGNTRFGKTEAIKLWCDMNPGIARLVNTPATNALGDLLREVARTLGIEYSPGRLRNDLRDRIDHVMRFSKLLLCFDESNFLLPGSYSKNTAPARLNWVRRSVVDRKTPAVFVHTPQNNGPAKKRFVKTTGYEMAQFDERIFTITLPTELSEDDLIAVARIHFPQLQQLHLKYVVSKTLATERNYVSDIEKIATLANYKAKAAGRTVPLLADINAAIANVLPAPKAAVPRVPVAAPGALIAQPPPRRSATALRGACNRAAAPLHASRITFLDSANGAENESTEPAVAT